MPVKTHKNLDVWKKPIGFVVSLYRLIEKFPGDEIYGLTSQLRRTSVSIPLNIAEGAARNYTKEFVLFLYIALASTAEIETQLIISEKLNYLKSGECDKLLSELDTIAKMI